MEEQSVKTTRRLCTAEILRVSKWIDENKPKILEQRWTYGDAAGVASIELQIEGLNAAHVATIVQADPSGFIWPTSRAATAHHTDEQAVTIDKLRRGMAALAAGQALPPDVAEWLRPCVRKPDQDADRPLLAQANGNGQTTH